jgi:hypothetical protein
MICWLLGVDLLAEWIKRAREKSTTSTVQHGKRTMTITSFLSQ